MWKYYSAKTDKRGRNHELGDVGGLCSLDKADSLLWPPEKMQPGHPCMVRAILNFWQSEIFIQFSSVHSLSRVRLFATPWTAVRQASLSITNSRSLPVSCALSRWCQPTISSPVIPFSSCPQSFPASWSFKWVSSLHQVDKVLEFQLQQQSFQWTPRTDLL